MDEQAVRARARVYCEALRAGDIGRAAEEMSHELRNGVNLFARLPTPD